MNVITTIPKRYFAQWKPVPGDPRINRYLDMHDGSIERRFLKCNGYGSDRGELEPKPWYWMVTMSQGYPTKVKLGDCCFMVYDGQVIGYFSIVDMEKRRKYWWVPDDDTEAKGGDDDCLVLATWTPGNYGSMTGFQGWRYTELRP